MVSVRGCNLQAEMSEVLTAERWREGRLEPCTAVSVRKGKYQHSVKYKHPNAYAMVDTNWRMGVDPASYTVSPSYVAEACKQQA